MIAHESLSLRGLCASRIRRLRVLLPILVVLGCSPDEATLEPPAPCPATTGISVSPAIANLAVGDSAQLTAQVIVSRGIPCAAVTLDGPFDWSIGDSVIARVQRNGVVFARGPGATVVTVRWAENRNFAAGAQLLVSR